MNIFKSNMAGLPNRVLIRLGESNEKLKTKSGVTLFMDTSYERPKHMIVRGTVISTPTLRYKRSLLEFDVDMELRVGDDIIYNYAQYAKNEKQEDIFTEDGHQYMFVNYDAIYCAVRDDRMIMINGFILVEPDGQKESEIIWTPTDEEQSEQSGVVRHMGSMVREYRGYKFGDPEGVNIGDKVYFRSMDASTMEYSGHATLEDVKTFYKMQRKDILGIFGP